MSRGPRGPLDLKAQRAAPGRLQPLLRLTRSLTTGALIKGRQAPPVPREMAQKHGRALGSAFARLGSATPAAAETAASFQDAIRRGKSEAEARRARERDLANDEDFLKQCGFGGPNDDEDCEY
jgi:hypothetical protein